jgi:hypothetical protein
MSAHEFDDLSVAVGGCVFHAISITDSTAKRSPIPRHCDHRFHGKAISDSTAIRSLIS